ncbi:OmpA family protein [Mariprofundus sp. EBB-1]|uniref:OmpA family protein n=1 Tax=Mariprofundus sp. EBB-1 TaxID=2650971 RepID=UPI000EF20A58|nr:OmpA family protein [Mariprofundus sp. EBB-1]RLL55022.1 OmpA family protein [Mariprofundus sp. EBB-1]
MNIRISTFIFTCIMLLAAPHMIWAQENTGLLSEAEAVRAPDLSPVEYSAAKQAFAQNLPVEAESHAKQAITNSLMMNNQFPALIESLDRMRSADAKNVRKELAERAETAFAKVVAAIEEGDLNKAKKESEMAKLLTYQAEVVAAREQLTRPVARAIAIAKSRKEKGNLYAPVSFAKASAGLQSIEQLVKANPAARGQLVNMSKQSILSAQKADNVGSLGLSMKQQPYIIEEWLDASNNDLASIAALLNLKLDATQSHQDQANQIKEAIKQAQTSSQNDLLAAQQKIKELIGDNSGYDQARAQLQQTQYKLKLKRDAEGKISQLAKLFNPNQVELFLTTDADVIIRMKAMNFPSGSAIVPSESYDLLELASKAIDLFNDREVRVEGHTDSLGNDEYNQTLSEHRAITVKEFLDARFAESNRVIASLGFGEDRPIANNEKEEGRKMNRRIDIVLVAPTMNNPPVE